MDQFWPIYSYPRLKLKCLGLLLCVTKSKNGPNHLFICQYQCFKEWVRLFLDFQPPLVNTTNVLFEYWTIDATVNFFSEETIIIWIWPSCIFSQILSLSLSMISVLAHFDFRKMSDISKSSYTPINTKWRGTTIVWAIVTTARGSTWAPRSGSAHIGSIFHSKTLNKKIPDLLLEEAPEENHL